MRKGLSTLLAILSLGTFSPSQAQEQPSAGVLGAVSYYPGIDNSKKLVQEKQGIDYLVDADLTSVLYSHANHLDSSSTVVDIAGHRECALTVSGKGVESVSGTLRSSYDQDKVGWYLTGYFTDSPQFPYNMRGRLNEVKEHYKDFSTFTFQGKLANKDITYTLYKNGELPTRIEGQWNNLEIIVTYTPSSNVKWLVDKADVTLRDISTKSLVAKYEIKYEQTERKVLEGTAIGYKGFTVTKK